MKTKNAWQSQALFDVLKNQQAAISEFMSFGGIKRHGNRHRGERFCHGVMYFALSRQDLCENSDAMPSFIMPHFLSDFGFHLVAINIFYFHNKHTVHIFSFFS
jgi:hypothetical protein